jgi:phytoene/squalene synthetase
MCVVSALGDEWGKGFPDRWPNVPSTSNPNVTYTFPTAISREEFDALKAEVEHLKELLKAAKIFDEATGQPDCEMDEKIELIRRVAELVGVDMDEVFGSPDQ